MKLIPALLVVIAFYLGVGIQAARAANPGNQSLGIGGGVSTPSDTDALADNPAGLMYNRELRILGAAASESKDFNPFSGTGRLLYGNGAVGLATGLHTYKEGREDRYSLDYGLGVYAEQLRSSIGVSGSTRLGKTPDVPGENHEINLGLLVNPYGSARLGAGLINVIGGAHFITGGFSTELSQNTTWSIDGSTNSDLKGTTVIPAFGFRYPDFQISLGYGFRINSATDSYLKDKFSAGVNICLGKNVELQGVYHHHSQYYAALIMDL